jgi:transcription initiation factor TFIID subunit TAF12
MSVLTKVLWGEMKVTAFDRVAAGQILVSMTRSTPQYEIEREKQRQRQRQRQTQTQRQRALSPSEAVILTFSV